MPRGLSDEDTKYVKMYILLPLILTAFERDKKIAGEVFKTSRPYVSLIEKAIRNAETDHKNVRQKFRELGLKVYEEKRTESGIEAKYLCRGYHHTFSMLWSLVVSDSSVLMEKYLGLDISHYVNPSIPGAEHDYDFAGR